MTDLILIRHSVSQPTADVDAHHWQLTTEGRRRCTILAEHLERFNVARIITSEEPKARQTGELVGQILEIPVQAAPHLHETRRETAPFYDEVRDFEAAVQAGFAAPEDVIFGEEAFTAARERFATQIAQLLADYPDETLAVVTHGTVLSLYLAPFADDDAATLWQQWGMPGYAVLSLPEKTLTTLVTEVS